MQQQTIIHKLHTAVGEHHIGATFNFESDGYFEIVDLTLDRSIYMCETEKTFTKMDNLKKLKSARLEEIKDAISAEIIAGAW